MSKFLFPNTEHDVDLKLLTRRPGRIGMDELLSGTLSRDSEDHFTFTQDTLVGKSAPAHTRNPHVYEGQCINVCRRADGYLYPTFRQPHYSDDFTFRDFCREAAEELLMVARVFDLSGLMKDSNGK